MTQKLQQKIQKVQSNSQDDECFSIFQKLYPVVPELKIEISCFSKPGLFEIPCHKMYRYLQKMSNVCGHEPFKSCFESTIVFGFYNEIVVVLRNRCNG